MGSNLLFIFHYDWSFLGCAKAGKSGVYSKVEKVLSWIKKNTRKCMPIDRVTEEKVKEKGKNNKNS